MATLPKRSFRRGRLSEQVVDELEKLISAEYSKPGERLPKEAELADRFKVSRIVIREAVKILEERGRVEVRAGSGTYTLAASAEKVKESLARLFQDQPIPALWDVERMLELREVLEETAAGLAAVRATEEDLAAMELALDQMDKGANDEEVTEADLRFHLAVSQAAHNPYFEMVLEPLTAVFIQQIQLTNSYNVGVDAHRQVALEIRKGNPVGARQAVRRLMRSTMDNARTALGLMNKAGGPPAEG
jgi:GntR family transcriptional repressor for pyruvate dehydrogenase complex